jgi:hypothetical protein
MKAILKGFKQGMRAFGDSIAVIVNSVLLAVVYLLGVGLTSIVCRLFLKRFLDLKPSKHATTYWVDINLKKRPIEEHYRQF